MTVSLAYSMKSMVRDNILVKELSACETMGNATAICSDKTGTLTQNRMTVLRAYMKGRQYEEATTGVIGTPAVAPLGSRVLAAEDTNPVASTSDSQLGAVSADLRHHIELAILVNSSAWIEPAAMLPGVPIADWRWKDGNQTEVAMLAWAMSSSSLKLDLVSARARTAAQLKEIEPFDSAKKYSAIIIERSEEERAAEGPNARRYRQYVKGAAEAIIAGCSREYSEGGDAIPADRQALLDIVTNFSRRGLRVLACAYRDLDCLPNEKSASGEEAAQAAGALSDCTLICLAGLSDPLRPTSYRSVRLCQRAGIVVRMVTGDHVETARFISKECGILTSPDQLCMTGADFRKMVRHEQRTHVPRSELCT